MKTLRDPVLEEFDIGEATVLRVLRDLHPVTGTVPERDTPEFSVESLGTIEEAIFDELDLALFIPETEHQIERISNYFLIILILDKFRGSKAKPGKTELGENRCCEDG